MDNGGGSVPADPRAVACEHNRIRRTIERNAAGEVWDDARCLDCGRLVRPIPPDPAADLVKAAYKLADELERVYHGPDHPQMSTWERALADAVRAHRRSHGG